MTYHTKDGLMLDGDNARDVLLNMRANAWYGCKDLEAYMAKVAKFAGYLTGKNIRSTTAEVLLKDLIDAKLVFVREQ